MLRSVVVLLSLMVLVGCSSTASLPEDEDLITFTHNKATDYTLLVYRSNDGGTRQVVRHRGELEFVLLKTESGDYALKKRGEEYRVLEPEAVLAVKHRVERLIYSDRVDSVAHPWESSL